MSNIRDVAEHAGVSMTTVSHVLNGRGRIADKTRARVLEAAAHLGYTANPHAQQLVTRRSRILVIQMPDLDCGVAHGVAVVPTSESEYFLELINGAAAAAADAKYALIVMSSGVDPSSMGGFGIDGMIIVDPKGTEGVLQPANKSGYPVVTTGEPVVATGAMGFVIDNDHQEATRTVMDHFIATGRTRPALIVDTTARSYIRDIVHAYTKWCGERQLDPAVVALSEMTSDQVTEALTSLRNRPEPVDAIYTSSDGSAIALLDSARKTHVSVPGQLAIASAVDSNTLRVTNPPVTGMYLHPREIGAQAVKLVTELIERQEPGCGLPPLATTRHLIPSHLSVRGSSAAPAIADEADNGEVAHHGVKPE